MLGALTSLLVGSLLQGVLCGEWSSFMPQSVEVVKGSCVTIPCSFDIKDGFENDLNNECKAIWKNTANVPKLTTMTGDLTKKDCTSTFDNITSDHSNQYYFRLECLNPLKYDFLQPRVRIVVTDDPPTPTLTPSPLEVKEGSSVSLTCSAPAPCWTHPPTLTWTPSLGDVQEEVQENQDKTKVKKSVLTFTASHLHHRKSFSCTVVYKKQDGSRDASVSRSLTAAVSFPPQILPSSDCTKTAGQINCSCETVGNPFPTLHWYLDGLPVNQSEFLIISERLDNDKGLRSFITGNQPQEMRRSTLTCRSFNSLGSASQHFSLEHQASAESHDQAPLLVCITMIVILFILVCALLCVIRAQKNRHNPNSHLTCEMSQVATSQTLIKEADELPNTTEEDIYVNTEGLRPPDAADPPTMSEPTGTAVPSSGPNNAKESDVIYSIVTWKSKKKKTEDSANMNPCGGSYLEEEKQMGEDVGRDFMSNALEMGNLYDEVGPRNVRKEAECEYAQVKFKDKSVRNK